jgi:hypothetical protein
MLAVEHVIKLFNPKFNAWTIAARRRQRTNPWFKRYLVSGGVRGLRTATAPMTVRKITDAILPAEGITDADKRQRLESRPG